MAAGDEVDRDHVRHQGDVGVLRRRGFERLADRPAGRVGDVDDAAVAVAALAGQVQRAIFGCERHAQVDQMLDRARRGLDDMLDDLAVVEARAGDHRVVDVGFEAVAFLEHRGDPALRASAGAVAERALGDHRDLVGLGKVECRGQPGRARTDDQDVGLDRSSRRASRLGAPRSDQAQEHVLEVGVAGRDVDDRKAFGGQRREHLAGVDLVLAEGDLERPLVDQRDILEAGLAGTSPMSWSKVTTTAFSCAFDTSSRVGSLAITRPWWMIAIRSHSSSASSR